METIFVYFLYFIIYSFIGWLMEVSIKSIQYKKFVNRGFLLGPICPIYGYGVLLLILLIRNTDNFFLIFFESIIICSLLEYLTSYFMEKIFKARWWDYSNKQFNLNGRICASTMIPFGVLGTIIIKYIHPLINNIVLKIPSNILIVVSSIIFIIYIFDNILSFNVMKKISFEIKKYTDNTEIIKTKIKAWLESKSFLYKHLRNAYPKFKISEKLNFKKNK